MTTATPADQIDGKEIERLYVWTAETLQQATAGQWHLPSMDTQDNIAIETTKISTDTRRITTGDVFLALSGERFDGHDYIAQAVEQGVVAVIVSRNVTTSVPQLMVTDTRLAFGDLARYRRLQHTTLQVVCLTGSSGKTTCKEMLGSILSQQAPTLITQGNLNNDIGVPMTLLAVSDHHQFAVIELGANHLDEIDYTVQIAQPQVACVLNIGTAHLGEFGGRDNILRAKAEIFRGITDDGVAVIPSEDDYTTALMQAAQSATSRVLQFGTADTSDIRAENIAIAAQSTTFVMHIDGQSYDIQLPFVGVHNVYNALAAAACAHAMKIDGETIASGLRRSAPAKGRLSSHLITVQGREHRLIDDAYNANPHSVRAAVDVLASQAQTRILVLGDIGELGDAAIEAHQQLGDYIANSDVEYLYCVGDYASYTVAAATQAGLSQAWAYPTKDNVLTDLLSTLQTQVSCTVLFKGSRYMQMETLIETLLEIN